jgi:hypothetical protein
VRLAGGKPSASVPESPYVGRRLSG